MMGKRGARAERQDGSVQSRAARRRRRRASRGGFTLVELAIVVTIVGVLAVLGVVGYRRYVLTSKISEAQTVISAIRIAQEDHKAERGTYANLGDTQYCPASAGNVNVKAAWTKACNGGVDTWEKLPVHVDGPVHFGYATVAGSAAFAAPTGTGWVAWGTPAAGPWYVVMARCDMDNDPSAYTELIGSSYTNQIFSRNEGL